MQLCIEKNMEWIRNIRIRTNIYGVYSSIHDELVGTSLLPARIHMARQRPTSFKRPDTVHSSTNAPYYADSGAFCIFICDGFLEHTAAGSESPSITRLLSFRLV